MIPESVLLQSKEALPRPAAAWNHDEIVHAYFPWRAWEHHDPDEKMVPIYYKYVRKGAGGGQSGWWDGPYLISAEEAAEIQRDRSVGRAV